MPEKKLSESLNNLLVDLSQTINVDYLAIIDGSGTIRASAGAPGELGAADLDSLLEMFFNRPVNMMIPGEVDEIRIIKKGLVECMMAPINGSVQLLALASIERPSVLARTILNELLGAREGIAALIKNEWKESPTMSQSEPEKGATIKESPESAGDPFETLIAGSAPKAKSKDASKFWDNATLDDQASSQAGQTISFDEAKRSGLVPEEKND
jgi:hypothetical protein